MCEQLREEWLGLTAILVILKWAQVKRVHKLRRVGVGKCVACAGHLMLLSL